MQPQPLPDLTAPEAGFDRSLSRAIDRATTQVERAIEDGDTDVIAIFRRQLDELEALIPEAER